MARHYIPVDQGQSLAIWPYWFADQDSVVPADPELSKSEKMISVDEFGKRHDLDEKEIGVLSALFGPFASKSELLANVSRRPLPIDGSWCLWTGPIEM